MLDDSLEAEMQRLDAEISALGAPGFSFMSLAKPELARERQRKLDAWRAANPERGAQRDQLLVKQGQLKARIEAAKWADVAQVQVFDRLAQLGVQKIHVDFVRTPQDVPAMRTARVWWPSNDWSLVLLGGYGAGKTSSAAWLAAQALAESKTVRWLRAPEACRHPLFGAEAEAWSARSRSADLLVLDDLGADVLTDHWRGWLEDVVDARWGNAKRTIITVNNLDVDGFRARVGPRLVDRLKTGRVDDCGDVSLRARRPRLGLVAGGAP